MDLKEHVQSCGTIGDVAAYLENLPPAERWAQLSGLSKKCQRTLYLKAEGAEPATFEDLVPEPVEAGEGVRHLGRNSLPMFRDFEKPMARAACGAPLR